MLFRQSYFFQLYYAKDLQKPLVLKKTSSKTNTTCKFLQKIEKKTITISNKKMRGKVDILVATQYNGAFVQIFRSLYYEYTPGDLTHGTAESKIYWFMKNNVDKINVMVEDDDTEGILRNIRHITIIYKMLPLNLPIIQRRMPRLLITFYEKIESLSLNIVHLIYFYTNLPPTEDTTKMLIRLNSVKEILSNAKNQIMSFWKQSPPTFFRMPLRVIDGESSVELFSSESFLPYIMGELELPAWTDPAVVEVINATRKKIQTREQTRTQREDYYVLLRLITRQYNLDWVLKNIIDYLPITLVFDLMISQTPWEFSVKQRVKDDITVQVT